MRDRSPASLVSTASICGVLLAVLACGGAGPVDAPQPDPEIEFAKPAPRPEVEGLAGELGFPVGEGGEAQVSDERTFEILHRSAFDAGSQWADYRDELEADGWTLRPTEIPPFEGVFVKEAQQISLSCELKGTSVFVRGTRLR